MFSWTCYPALFLRNVDFILHHWSHSWTLTLILLVLLPHVVGENFFREKSSTSHFDLLCDLFLGSLTVVPIVKGANNSFTLALMVELTRILNGRQILLLLVQVILVHLFLELDVFFVNSVDLLSEVLMLPLKSLNQLILRFELLRLLVVPVVLDLHLASQGHELLGFGDHLHEGFFLSVASGLARVSLE